jgi:hypothetical protein
MAMSISFRNDQGSNGHRVVGVSVVGSPLAAEARAVDSSQTLLPPLSYTIPVDPRSLDARSPDVRSPDVRSIDPRFAEIKNGAAPRDPPDMKMDQIRELLFGEVQRQSEVRISTLEARVRELETAFQHSLDAMQVRIDALAAETRNDRNSALNEMARAISELGDRVKRIPRD